MLVGNRGILTDWALAHQSQVLLVGSVFNIRSLSPIFFFIDTEYFLPLAYKRLVRACAALAPMRVSRPCSRRAMATTNRSVRIRLRRGRVAVGLHELSEGCHSRTHTGSVATPMGACTGRLGAIRRLAVCCLFRSHLGFFLFRFLGQGESIRAWYNTRREGARVYFDRRRTPLLLLGGFHVRYFAEQLGCLPGGC